MRRPWVKRSERAGLAQDKPTPMHGIACQCSMCGFTALLPTVSLDLRFKRFPTAH